MKVWVITKNYDWGSDNHGTSVYAVVDSEPKMIATIQQAERELIARGAPQYVYSFEAVEVEIQ